MITYKSDVQPSEWETLIDLYDETNMFIGLGRKREIEKNVDLIKKAINILSHGTVKEWLVLVE